MIATQKTVINGGTYELTRLAAEAGGTEVYRKLHKWILPIIGAFGDSAAGTSSFATFAERFAALLANDECWELFRRLMVDLSYNGRPVAQDASHWTLHLADLHEVVIFALKVNYEDVFTAAVGKLPRWVEAYSGAMSRLQATSTPSPIGSSPVKSPP